MIPVFDIRRQNKDIGKELKLAMMQVVDKGVYILGGKVKEFENAFAKYLGVKYAVGVASGTDAISLALLALGIGTGDEVIMPANSYPSVFAVTAIGAVPKLVDINPLTYTIDPDKIPKVITKRTKAILPVHMYGQAAEMEPVLKIGNKYKIPIVEDCAQAHGATLSVAVPELSSGASWCHSGKPKAHPESLRDPGHLPALLRKALQAGARMTDWKKVGSLGTLGCFSFYPTKNLGCFGDGGMVVTNDRDLADKVRLFRMYGEMGRYNSILSGRNSRLDEIQAAILSVKLKYLDKWNDKRRKLASLYISLLSDSPFLCSPKEMDEKKGWPGEDFSISLTSDSQGEPSDIASVSPLLSLSKRNYEKSSRASNKFNLQPTTYNLQLPHEVDYAKHIYHLFVIRARKRDQLKEYLKNRGIMTAIHYPTPVHLVPSMKYLGYQKGDFPESEKASREVLSLPMFPELKEEEVEKVTNAVNIFNDK